MPRIVAKAESRGAHNILARRENIEQGLGVFSCNPATESEEGLLTCHLERRILLAVDAGKTTDGHFSGSL
jgi:hypothetical protein